MEIILIESLLPTRYTLGTAVVVTCIELHKDEPPIMDRASLLEQGCVLLRFLPQCIYVKPKNATENFLGRVLPAGAGAGAGDGAAAVELGEDLTGVIAIEPKSDPGDSLPSITRNLYTCGVHKYHCSPGSRAHCTEFKGLRLSLDWWLTGDSHGSSAWSLVGLRTT